MAQIHVRLDDETKAEWKDFAEREGYDNLSRLIRKAVERERNGEQPTVNQASTGSETISIPDNVATSKDVDKVGDSILQLVDRIEDMEKRLKMTEKGVLEPNDKRAVMEALPNERPDPEELDEHYNKSGEPDLESPSGGIAYDGTVESIATVAGEPMPATRAFLSESVIKSENMKGEKIEGELRFWVEQ